MDVVPCESFEIARRTQIHLDVAPECRARRLESVPRRVVQQQRADAEAAAFDQPLDDESSLGDEQTVHAKELGIGHVAVRRDPGIVGPANARHLHHANQIALACRMTASDFRRISCATSKGSPS